MYYSKKRERPLTVEERIMLEKFARSNMKVVRTVGTTEYFKNLLADGTAIIEINKDKEHE